MPELSPTSLAAAINISVPYASQLLSGAREMPRDVAVRIFRATGQKLGPIAEATDEQVETLALFPERLAVEPRQAA